MVNLLPTTGLWSPVIARGPASAITNVSAVFFVASVEPCYRVRHALPRLSKVDQGCRIEKVGIEVAGLKVEK